MRAISVHKYAELRPSPQPRTFLQLSVVGSAYSCHCIGPPSSLVVSCMLPADVTSVVCPSLPVVSCRFFYFIYFFFYFFLFFFSRQLFFKVKYFDSRGCMQWDIELKGITWNLKQDEAVTETNSYPMLSYFWKKMNWNKNLYDVSSSDVSVAYIKWTHMNCERTTNEQVHCAQYVMCCDTGWVLLSAL